ncbi:uncharacterized protein LOC106144039 [Microtus ochrogaster]|uniref:Uncharacterized protein LOC106144039 n=1 Tax=Microtus ochrogaster TaxID=79684 RepID=A0ABM1AP14_MICOH|nr:uncharacterized protein LOC106144039 [Microtus ochrogaster]
MSGWEMARAPRAFTHSALGELGVALVLCNRRSPRVPPLQTRSRCPAPMTSRGRQVILGLWRQAPMTSPRRGAFPLPPPPAWLVQFTWVGQALPPPPTCGGRSPAGGGVTYLKGAGPGRGCRARRRPAGLHTIARLRRGPKVRPRGGRPAPLPDPIPPRSARRLHGVPSAIAGSPQSPLPAQSPRSPQSPPQRTHPAPSLSRRAPRSPRPAAARLRTPGVRYPENAGRPPAHPAALSPGSAAAARRRRRRSRASAEGERPPHSARCSLHRGVRARVGEGAGAGASGEQRRAPPREADRPLPFGPTKAPGASSEATAGPRSRDPGGPRGCALAGEGPQVPVPSGSWDAGTDP